MCPETLHLWTNATKKLAGKDKNVSMQWAPFFSSFLVSPSNYSWARKFMESDIWDFFCKNLTTITIKIPDNCPEKEVTCLTDELHAPSTLLGSKPPTTLLAMNDDPKPPETTQAKAVEILNSNSFGSKKGQKAKISVVESEVTRSPRLKEYNKGFKASTCTSKKCLACNPKPSPPDLSSDLIKKLGSTFCQIDKELLTDKALNKKCRSRQKS